MISVSRDEAVLLVVDVQERLSAAMSEGQLGLAIRNITILIEAARRFAMPVVCTQQYPKGLGPTLEPIEQALASLPAELVHRYDKLEFSCCDAQPFDQLHRSLGRPQWIVTGMESHVCVFQTVRGLRERGAVVHLVRDAVLSRSRENFETGLHLCERAGAVVTSTETVVFDLLGRAGTDDFKALSRLIR